MWLWINLSEWAFLEELLLPGQAQGCGRGFAKVFLLAFSCCIPLVLHLVSHQARNYSEIDFSSIHKGHLANIALPSGQWESSSRLYCAKFHRDHWHSVALKLMKPLEKNFQNDLEKIVMFHPHLWKCIRLELYKTCSRIMQYVIFCVWFLSLSIKFSRFIHAVAYCQYFIPFDGWIIFIHFAHPFISFHLDCFHFCL